MMKKKICFIFELLLKIATIIFAFWGVCLQARDDGGFISSNTYLYFTIISNLETVIIFSVFVVLRIAENIKGKQIIPKPLFMLKFMITAAMTITLTVAALLLAPLKDNVYLFSMKNLSLHIIAPILAMIDFLMIDRGQLNLNDEVEIVGLTDEKRKVVVTGIEMFRKLLDYAEAGDNIGALLRGVQRNEIERGQVLSKPGTIHPHTKFKGEVYVLTKDEGGRHTPFFNNYRPQFYFRTTDVTGVITLPEGTEMCMPGDNVKMEVELITPIAIEKGLRFAIREGGRTVGSGVVSEIEEA